MQVIIARWTLFLLLAVTGCATSGRPDLRIDNSSLESFRTSWQALYESRSASERRNLDNALLQIAFAPYKSATELPDNLLGGIGPETIRGQIDGLNYEGIVQLAGKSSVKLKKPDS